MGYEKACASALPFFHALTGHDTASAFSGRGKNLLGHLECSHLSFQHFLTVNAF